MSYEISSILDTLADHLEKKGLTKEAYQLDIISNTLEAGKFTDFLGNIKEKIKSAIPLIIPTVVQNIKKLINAIKNKIFQLMSKNLEKYKQTIQKMVNDSQVSPQIKQEILSVLGQKDPVVMIRSLQTIAKKYPAEQRAQQNSQSAPEVARAIRVASFYLKNSSENYRSVDAAFINPRTLIVAILAILAYGLATAVLGSTDIIQVTHVPHALLHLSSMISHDPNNIAQIANYTHSDLSTIERTVSGVVQEAHTFREFVSVSIQKLTSGDGLNSVINISIKAVTERDSSTFINELYQKLPGNTDPSQVKDIITNQLINYFPVEKVQEVVQQTTSALC